MTNNPVLLKEAFDRHLSVAEESAKTLLPVIEKSANVLLEAVQSRNQILLCGNGGSAADCQHFAAELVGRYKNERSPLRAIALTTDTSALTAIGNDYGFDKVFSRQVEALGSKGDVLIMFSTSGSSKNVLKAATQAKSQSMQTILLTGEKGKGVVDNVDITITVPSKETARIQEIHELIFHVWCEFIDANITVSKNYES